MRGVYLLYSFFPCEITKMNKKFIVILVLLLFADNVYGKERNRDDKADLCLRSYSSNSRPVGITTEGRGFCLHKENYFLPFSFNDEGKYPEDGIFKFQFSFKQRILNTRAYFGFTQKSFWRAYDTDHSSPFRESNYNPELFYDVILDNEVKRGVYLGAEHESNGQSAPLSRSWNRLYIWPYYETNKYRVDFKLWYRVPEDKKRYAGDPEGDDNEDIEDYLGHFELRFKYQLPNNNMISFMGRSALDSKHGAVEVNFTTPTPMDNAFFILQAWSGYGESLIDYNRYTNRLGIGIMYKR